MKTIRTLAIALFIILAHGATQAQMVTPVGLGVRLNPDGAGFDGKFFFDKNLAIEAQLNASGGYYNIDNDGPSMTIVGLLEYHIMFADPSWRLYFGPGIHFGSWDRYGNGYYEYYNGRPPQGIFGIDGILGLEYVLKSFPVGFSADIKPAMNFATDVAYFPNNSFGLSARYYFGRRMVDNHHQNQPTNN